MSTISITRRKLKFSFLVLFVLIFASILVSRGTIGYSANFINNEGQGRKPDFQTSDLKLVLTGTPFQNYAALSPSFTFSVNNNGDSSDAVPGDGACADSLGNCTLRAAIQEANATVGTDTISFSLTSPAIIQLNSNLSPAELVISEAVIINGPGARFLTVKGNSGTTAGIFKITYAEGTTTSISGISVANSVGNGINNEAKLNLADVTLRDNGTGIYNTGQLNITRATINNNSNSGLFLTASSTVNISNSTIHSNATVTSGGGIHTLSANVTLNNLTISDNTAAVSGGGIYYGGASSGVYVRNTIIASNNAPANAGPDVFSLNNATGANFVSRFNNLIGISTVNMGFVNDPSNPSSDKVGTATAIDPLLGPLQNNGGQTDTRSLLIGSPALNAGNSCVANSNCGSVNPPTTPLLSDQRGSEYPRLWESSVDIGAFEAFYLTPSISSFVPNNWGTGKGAFILTVNGSNFVVGSTVKWNGVNKTTTFVSNTQIKANISASDVATAGQFPVVVSNPEPNGGISEEVNFTVVDCSYSINSTSQSFSNAGGNGSITMTAINGCEWTAVTDAPSWITVTSGASGTGGGTVQFTVAANNGIARTGTIIIGGQTFTVNQGNGCTYSISPSNQSFSPSGGNASFSITSGAGCAWTAVSSHPWITITGGVNGSGNGTVSFSVASNNASARNGTITAGGQTFTVNQANGCTYALSSASISVPPAGITSSFNVTAAAGCSWTATASDPWVAITAGNSGNGDGTVAFTVSQNNGTARSATITVNGQTFTINQANGCSYSISPGSKNLPSADGTDSFSVIASNSGCGWSVVSNDSWIVVTSGANGTGSANVQFTVSANTGAERSGSITAAGKTFNIIQEAGCVYSLSSTNASYSATGGSGSFNILVNNRCGWTAVSNDPWITINSGASGSGNGSISYTVQPNTGPQRSGTIKAGGQTFTVNQSNGCNYSLSASAVNVPADGGTGNFNIIAGAGCTWSAQSNDSWITVTSGNSGSGNGTVAFSVAPYNGPARSGTITAGGKTFTITQANGCTFTISPSNQSFSPSGGSGSFSITAGNPTCTWAAVSNDSWITVTAGAAGTGNGTISFTVAANVGPARPGTISVGGQTFTVNQGNGCVYSISPTSMIINESGGNGSFNISAIAVCSWSAVSNDPWITILSGAGGNGNGTISFSAAANTGMPRTGTITVGGQTFTVNQISLTVTNLNDSGVGSLRQAVINANNAPSNDVITFQPGLIGTIFLTSGEIVIANNGALEIKGLGANVLSVSTNYSSRIFYTNNAVVTITDLTLTRGNANGIGSSNNSKYGGAIYANEGTLTLNRVHVTGNTITVSGIQGARGIGGGVYINAGTNHLIQNSTFSVNSSTFGGGLYSQYNTLNIVNSTFYRNDASKQGGGIYSVAETTLRNVTLTNNSSSGIAPNGAGVVIAEGSFTFGNTIIAGNAGAEISYLAGEILSLGNNLIGDSAGDSANTETLITYKPTDILDTQPQFATFEMYGGKTPTLALLADSPAINAGNNAGAPAFDQRGSVRIIDGTIDIGAFENNIVVLPSVLTLPSGEVNAFYNKLLSASRIGGIDPNESFNFSAEGLLPDGLNLWQDGRINGTPTVAGVYTFFAKAFGIDGMGGARKYEITIACSYSIGTQSQTFNSVGGSGTVNLTALSGCDWTAVSNVPWITITSGASGNGNGTIAYSVQPNTGARRSGTITIGGQTFTVIQETACAFSLSSTSTSVSSAAGTGSFNVNTTAGCNWTAASNDSWISVTGGATGNGNGTVAFSVAANNGSMRNGTIIAAGKSFTVTQAANRNANVRTAYDFDGDGKADISVFRPENGGWYLLNSSSGFTATQFGISTDKLAPADYDGDGKTDVAVFRDGTWYLLRSSSGFTGIGFGVASDIPVPADYDGDGKSEIAVFRPSNGGWYIYNLVSNQFDSLQFGQVGDIPVVGDYDGDGKADVAVFRSGIWYIQRSQLGFTGINFGVVNDKPVPADYDGDGKTDAAVFRPSNGTWYMQQSRDGFTGMQFGLGTDKAAPADFDGDGKGDLAIFRDGTWYLQRSRDGFTGVGFGAPSDKPVPGAFIP